MKLVEECEGKLNADGQTLFLLLWNYRCPSSSTVAAQNTCLSTAPAPGNVSLHGFISLSFPLPGGISICGAKPTPLYYTKFQRHNPAEIKVFIPCPLPLICESCSFLHDVLFQGIKIGKLVRTPSPFWRQRAHCSNFHWPQLPRIRKGSTLRKYAPHVRLSLTVLLIRVRHEAHISTEVVSGKYFILNK